MLQLKGLAPLKVNCWNASLVKYDRLQQFVRFGRNTRVLGLDCQIFERRHRRSGT
jgi:hypothetical protein